MKIFPSHSQLRITTKKRRNGQNLSCKEKIASWCEKWNRSAAALIALVLFFIMLVWVIWDKTHKKPKHDEEKSLTLNIVLPQKPMKTNKAVDLYSENTCTYDEECLVTCKEAQVEDLPNFINNANNPQCTSDAITLTLEDTKFLNGKVEKDWLKDVEIDITTLEIHSKNLKDIGAGAFSGKPFQNLRELTIVESSIKILKKEFFQGSTISTFQIRFDLSTGDITAEAGALESISGYLTTAQFTNCFHDAETIQNLTGTNTGILSKLVELDLRYNSLTKITKKSFTNAPKLISLYLNGNTIKFEAGAFSGIQSNIKLIQFEDNSITTLPEGLFDGFVGSGQIFIQQNSYNCDCQMVWFREFYKSNQEKYFKNIPFKCETDKGSVSYTEIDFCDDPPISKTSSTTKTTTPAKPTSSTKTSTTYSITPTASTALTISSTTPSSTTPNEDKYEYMLIECDLDQDPLYGIPRSNSKNVKVRQGNITINFQQLEDTPQYHVTIIGLENPTSDSLIWSDAETNTVIGCACTNENVCLLKNLKHERTYTLCLLPSEMTTVAPQDCTALSVPPEWGKQSWIQNNNKGLVIAIACAASILLALLIGIGVFYLIRQHPHLIKGNKRVVVVKNKSTDVLVMPNYGNKIYRKPESMRSRSHGYLTPKHRFYEYVEEPNLYVRTVSEACGYDRQCVGSRTRRIDARMSCDPCSFEEVHEDACPPPLPPNHPSENVNLCNTVRSGIYSRI